MTFRLENGSAWLDYKIQTPKGSRTVKSEQVDSLSGTEKQSIAEAFR
jgi:hypothetical protein